MSLNLQRRIKKKKISFGHKAGQAQFGPIQVVTVVSISTYFPLLNLQNPSPLLYDKWVTIYFFFSLEVVRSPNLGLNLNSKHMNHVRILHQSFPDSSPVL